MSLSSAISSSSKRRRVRSQEPWRDQRRIWEDRGWTGPGQVVGSTSARGSRFNLANSESTADKLMRQLHGASMGW